MYICYIIPRMNVEHVMSSVHCFNLSNVYMSVLIIIIFVVVVIHYFLSYLSIYCFSTNWLLTYSMHTHTRTLLQNTTITIHTIQQWLWTVSGEWLPIWITKHITHTHTYIMTKTDRFIENVDNGTNSQLNLIYFSCLYLPVGFPSLSYKQIHSKLSTV